MKWKKDLVFSLYFSKGKTSRFRVVKQVNDLLNKTKE